MTKMVNIHSKMKKLLIAMFVLLLVTPLALADFNVFVEDIDNTYGPLSVVAGQNLPIEVYFDLSSDYTDAKVEVELSYDGKEVEAESEAMDIIAGTTYKRSLDLRVPTNIDTTPEGEEYTLSVRLKSGKGKTLASADFDLTVQRKSDDLEIQKVLGPSSAEAGKPVIWTVVVKNIGSKEQEDVYVKIVSPELGLLVEERAGDIEATDEDEDEDVSTVDVPLRLPKDAYDGTYAVKVTVYNDDFEVTATKSLKVDGTKKAEDSTEVVPVARNLAVEQGATGVYQLTLLNLGNSEQTYSLSVEGLEGWASYQANPLSVVLSPQSNRVVDLGLTVSENALVGEHAFEVKVLSNGEEVREIALTTEVKESSSGVSGMLVSVIVLAIVLIVLIVLLVKMRRPDEVEESEESYY